MSLPQHSDALLRFQQQADNSRNDVLPFIEEGLPVQKFMHVLEIGCGEGGVLLPFLEKGCPCIGVDLVPERIRLASHFLQPYIESQQLKLVAKNIYDPEFLHRYQYSFHLILLKDAIEHIPEQEKLLGHLKNLLAPDGQIFFGFPPWQMPFGGHQQICRHRWISKWPYLHLLPKPIYRKILEVSHEPASTVQELMELKATGLSIEKFESILAKQTFTVTHQRFYLVNPIYRYKFNLQPKVQYRWIGALPYLRNFVTTCVYYLVRPGN